MTNDQKRRRALVNVQELRLAEHQARLNYLNRPGEDTLEALRFWEDERRAAQELADSLAPAHGIFTLGDGVVIG